MTSIALKATVVGRKKDRAGNPTDRWEIKVWFDGTLITQPPWYCQTFLDPNSTVRPNAQQRRDASRAEDELDDGDDDDDDDSERSDSGDESSDASSSVDDDDDDAFTVHDSRSKTDREWTIAPNGIRTDPRTSPKFKPTIVGLAMSSFTDPLDLFLHFFPTDEFEGWAMNSRESIRRAGHEPPTALEYQHCVGIILAASLGPRHGGYKRWFSESTHRLIPGMRLGEFGLSRTRFQMLMRYLTIDRAASRNRDLQHSAMQGFVARWNERMAEAFHCGWITTLDESMLWGYQRDIEHLSFVKRKPRAIGTEGKCGGDATTRIMTVMEFCESADQMGRKAHVKEYGKSVATSLRLCEAAGWTTSGRVIIGDSWFGSLHFAMMCREHGMHAIGMVKTNTSGFPKRKLRDRCGKERGDHIAATIEIDGERYHAVAENDKCIKTFIATCSTTQPGSPAHKKRHAPDGKRLAGKLAKRTKTSETYYDAMPMVDINNHLRQSGLALEVAYGTHSATIRQLTSMLGIVEVNVFLARRYFCKFTGSHEEATAALALRLMGSPRAERTSPRRSSSGSSAEADSSASSASSAGSSGSSASVNANNAHEIGTFDEWKLKQRQQVCVYCYRTSGVHNNTSFYCKKCAGQGSPTRAAICLPIRGVGRQCYALHVACGIPPECTQRRVGRGLLPHMVAETN